MRIIKRKTLLDFAATHADAREPLLSWFEEVEKADWSTPNEVRSLFRSADILTSKRVIFNIKGNHYRLIVDIEYQLKIVFIAWLGTHSEYDKIDAKTIQYGA